MNNHSNYEPSFCLFSAEFIEKEPQSMLPYGISVLIIATSKEDAQNKLTAYLDGNPKGLEKYVLDEFGKYCGVYLEDRQFPSVFYPRSLGNDSIILF